MALLAAILLAVFVVPRGWALPVVLLGALWEAGEFLLWIAWSRRRRAQVGVETLVGGSARTVSALDPEGQVQVQGELWRARTLGAEAVAAGEEVRIVALEGLTLVVEPLRGAP